MGWVHGIAVTTMAAFLGACASTHVAMPPAQSTALTDTNRTAFEPAGFTSFCERFSDQCRPTPGGSSTIQLTPQTWILLNAVNEKVNGAIWPEDDLKHYGRAEYWTIPTDGYGDCEDYALTKRRDLLQAGLPSEALRLAVVYSEAAGRHAVLTVGTDKGDMVLDNMVGQIKTWRDSGYVWIERQDAANPMRWVALGPSYSGDQTTAVGGSNIPGH